MKITPEHYQELEQMLDAVVEELGRWRLESHRDAIIQQGKAKDVEKRLRWDLFWLTNAERRTAWIDKVYAYCNDDHIDTALRQYTGDRGLAKTELGTLAAAG